LIIFFALETGISSQVELLITNNSFFIVPRATAQSKTGMFRGYGEAEAPPGFQAGWSDCMYFYQASINRIEKSHNSKLFKNRYTWSSY
jgi:hypothetical protein